MTQIGSARLTVAALTLLVAAFLLLPSALMALSALSAGNILTFPPQGLSLRWFAELAGNRAIRGALANSAEVSLLATVIAALAGTPASVALARLPWSLRPLMDLFLLLPFIIPAVVTAVGFMTVFGAAGLLGNLPALSVALAAFNLPFMIAAVSATAARLDPHLDEAASSCGAPPVERFLTVTLPTLLPGVISGALLLFVLTFNEYVVSSFMVDVHSMTLPVQVFNSGRGATTPLLAAISVLYFAISLVAIWAVDRLAGIEAFFRSSH